MRLPGNCFGEIWLPVSGRISSAEAGDAGESVAEAVYAVHVTCLPSAAINVNWYKKCLRQGYRPQALAKIFCKNVSRRALRSQVRSPRY